LNKGIDISGATIISARNSTVPVTSKPCSMCEILLREFNIKSVIYSTLGIVTKEKY